MMDSSHMQVTVAPGNLGNTRWEVDIKELYVIADTRAEAMFILEKTFVIVAGGGVDDK